ncbi:MAG TPA: hypothetical protein ENO14_02400 [Chromatiales bacterium]|nr:hypothetical protein [Chromatiales bacterium]
MHYNGRYKLFDPQRIATYPLAGRRNKVMREDLLDPASLPTPPPADVDEVIDALARAIAEARQADRPVVLFTGAHAIKNGLGLLLIDLVRRGAITLVAGNGATAIHDFELAMIGQTSEDVPRALQKGRFGMAREFACFNAAILEADRDGLGLGEGLGRMMCESTFRHAAAVHLPEGLGCTEFHCPEVSVLAACYRAGVPFTVHVGIGTDVVDQHPSFNGGAKGATSGRDFLIFVEHIARMQQGGIVLNLGSAVTGPEVLLKAVSMAVNVGRSPQGVITADFDLRPYDPAQMNDEGAPGYYYRDQKSIVTRIPAAFGGRGLYVRGNQKDTVVRLYQRLVATL